MKCLKSNCNGMLEEHEFDPRIGVCDKCDAHFTDKEYDDILESVK